MDLLNWSIKFTIKKETIAGSRIWMGKYSAYLVCLILAIVSVANYIVYFRNGLGVAYNDARSHLDIGRRVVEGLNTGVAQLGSVWLPLTHILMIPTVWNDFMWHSGLAGALPSMLSFVGTGLLIYLFLKELDIGITGRLIGVAVFATNLNILYLQSTAMTELVLLATMTAGAYFFLLWYKRGFLFDLIQAAFWIMLSTLVRYDGWFLFLFAVLMIFAYVLITKNYVQAEGTTVMFCTLAGFGIVMWLLWNKLIFKDPLYFIFGPYSAYTQQSQLESAGVLVTKHNLVLSTVIYTYAMAFNSGALTVVLGFLGALFLWLDKRLVFATRAATLILLTPLLFNITALYFGHSVLFLQGFSGNTWFNVRYGIMMMPSFAIFVGYLAGRVAKLRAVMVGLLALVVLFSYIGRDVVTIDDAKVGSSSKNVTEVSSWLRDNIKDKPGFVLISVASHDSIIFTSGLPMKKFIHEGAGEYYAAAIQNPDRWARWIVMRSNSDDDSTWKAMKDNPGFKRFHLVDHYPFADIYELDDKYVDDLITEPILNKK